MVYVFILVTSVHKCRPRLIASKASTIRAAHPLCRIASDSATVKVINLYKGFLPDAGGPGTMLLYTAGILLIVCGGVWLMLRMKSGKKGKKQRKAAASASGETITLDDLSDFLKDRR